MAVISLLFVDYRMCAFKKMRTLPNICLVKELRQHGEFKPFASLLTGKVCTGGSILVHLLYSNL